MKTDKHFRSSEMYFSINFNMEAQAQDAQCRKRQAAQVQEEQGTSSGFQAVSGDLTLADWGQRGAQESQRLL